MTKQEEVIEKQLQKVIAPLAAKLSEAVDILIPVQLSNEEKAEGMDKLLEEFMPVILQKIETVDVRALIVEAREAMKEKKDGNK